MMGEYTGISWTDHTFNPWWGCTETGPGCDACYAREWAAKWGYRWGHEAPRRYFGEKHWNEPLRWNRKAMEQGKRKKVFCASMADVFDNEAEESERAKLWPLLRKTPWLDWQLVTKRIGNAPKMLPPDWGDGYPNVWLIITVVNQEEADRDILKLLKITARIHGISYEPALGPVDWHHVKDESGFTFDAVSKKQGIAYRGRGLDWIIVGGESEQPGHTARPFDIQWARSTISQCREARIACFVKQLGSEPYDSGCVHLPVDAMFIRDPKGAVCSEWPEDLRVQEFPYAA